MSEQYMSGYGEMFKFDCFLEKDAAKRKLLGKIVKESENRGKCAKAHNIKPKNSR